MSEQRADERANLDSSVRAAAYPLRRVLVLVLAFASVIVAYGQMALGLGQSPAEFAADGDETLRAAGWAFSIWGLIYLGLLVYAVYQALPRTPESPLVRLLGWPSVAALGGITLWIAAAAADWEWTSVILIFASALVLLAPLVDGAGELDSASRRQRLLVAWPLALLAGWLSLAAVVNLATVVTGQGLLPETPGPQVWGVLAVVLVTVLALAVTWRTRLWIYALPVAWGLVGVFAAEQGEGDSLLAFAALAAAFLVAVAAGLLARRRPL